MGSSSKPTGPTSNRTRREERESRKPPLLVQSGAALAILGRCRDSAFSEWWSPASLRFLLLWWSPDSSTRICSESSASRPKGGARLALSEAEKESVGPCGAGRQNSSRCGQASDACRGLGVGEKPIEEGELAGPSPAALELHPRGLWADREHRAVCHSHAQGADRAFREPREVRLGRGRKVATLKRLKYQPRKKRKRKGALVVEGRQTLAWREEVMEVDQADMTVVRQAQLDPPRNPSRTGPCRYDRTVIDATVRKRLARHGDCHGDEQTNQEDAHTATLAERIGWGQPVPEPPRPCEALLFVQSGPRLWDRLSRAATPQSGDQSQKSCDGNRDHR
jgi:hypothetical protein